MRLYIYILIYNLLLFPLFIYSQEIKQKSKNWLVTKTKKEVEPLKKTINFTMSNGIVPHAFNRNNNGEFLFISQTTPPSLLTTEWKIERYATEKKMMQYMEINSKKAWVPNGFDIQTDGAFVQYVKNGLQVTAIRLIKINSSQQITPTLQLYFKLGFTPTALSTYKTQLWILFAQYNSINASSKTIYAKSIPANNKALSLLLNKILADNKTRITGITFTNENNNIIILFETPNE